MKKRTENPVYQKSFDFAVKIVQLCKNHSWKDTSFVLFNQVLRSGTSIGANVREALEGQTKKDFIAKLAISLKEASETEYWLDLLKESDYLETELYKILKSDLKEVIRLLNSIIKSTKTNMIEGVEIN